MKLSKESLQKIISTSSSYLKENSEFIKKLKKRTPKDLDETIHLYHEEVFEKIDCLDCANCCKTTSPAFYKGDIERMSSALKQKTSQFIDYYLHTDEDHDYVLNEEPCPFLDGNNYCIVYESRPTACREYPHTDRRRMHQILDLTLKNTLICPAVFLILEKMRKGMIS